MAVKSHPIATPLTRCGSVLPLALAGLEEQQGMMGVDTIGEIRRAYFEQHRPINEIARALSVSRATVRKVVRSHKTEFSGRVKLFTAPIPMS